MRQLPLSAPACLLALSPPGSTRETRLLWPITCDDDGGESKPLSFVMRKSGDGVARVERERGGEIMKKEGGVNWLGRVMCIRKRGGGNWGSLE